MMKNRIREKRWERHWSQWDLALAVGKSQEQISIWERNYRQPDDKMKKKIAKAFGCSVEEVFPQEKP